MAGWTGSAGWTGCLLARNAAQKINLFNPHSRLQPALSTQFGPANMDKKEKKKAQLAQRRQQQKEKKNARKKCHICGHTGHTRRECPGVEDGGRGQSVHRNPGKGTPLSDPGRGGRRARAIRPP